MTESVRSRPPPPFSRQPGRGARRNRVPRRLVGGRSARLGDKVGRALDGPRRPAVQEVLFLPSGSWPFPARRVWACRGWPRRGSGPPCGAPGSCRQRPGPRAAWCAEFARRRVANRDIRASRRALRSQVVRETRCFTTRSNSARRSTWRGTMSSEQIKHPWHSRQGHREAPPPRPARWTNRGGPDDPWEGRARACDGRVRPHRGAQCRHRA